LRKLFLKIAPLFVLAGLLAGLVAGCAGETETTSTTQTTTTTTSASTTATATTSTTTSISVIDQTGVSVVIPADIRRVVSVYPMSTLITYSLGGQDKLVGIDSNSPKNARLQEADPNIGKITQVGMPWQVNLETVVSLDPDVVLGASGDVRKSLEEANIPVIGVNLESPEKLKAGIALIGQCIGETAAADTLITYYDEKMDLITSRTRDIPEAERIRVLIPNKTGVLSCAGGDTYQQYLIEGAGGVNVAQDITGQWPQASLEQIMLWDPQVIIVPPYCADMPEAITSDSAWGSIDAVKNHRVYLMPQYTVAWDTPVADSILGELWIAKKLYPDKFADLDINTLADEFYIKFYGIHYVWQKTITDSTGAEITIPSHVESVATLREGITEIVCALGAKGKIIAVEDGVKSGTSGYGAFITGIYPELKELDCPIIGKDPNLEEMLRINPDVILIGGMGRLKWVEPLQTTGLPVVVSHFETLENYMDDIRIVAQVVNAEPRAEELITYLQSKLDFVSSRVSNISGDEKVKVLFVGHDVYHVYTTGTFEDTQIAAAGGINVAAEMTGWLPEVSPEQIITWNPDVIISLNGVSTDDIINDAKIADVAAVKSKKVYALPESGWDFASPRALFAIEWLGTKFYPEKFADVDIIGEADEFYQTVFGVNYGGPALAETRIVTDMAGRTVVIPADPSRIASIFPYITYTSLALGAGDKLVAIDTASSNNANLAKIYPKVKGIPAVGSAFNVNKESVLLADPDLVLTVTWDREPDKTQSTLNKPLLCVDMDYYKESINFIARVTRTQGQAKQFTDYFDTKTTYLDSKLKAIPEAEQPKVYFAAGSGIFSTYGAESTWHFELADAWGINVAAELTGGGALTVSPEQLLAWNPDVIILDKSCQDSVASVLANLQLQSVNAIKNQQVFRAPDGYLDTFGRPHLESVLSRLWIADKIYPGKTGLDMVKEARDFYSEFYGVTLSDEEIDILLNPKEIS